MTIKDFVAEAKPDLTPAYGVYLALLLAPPPCILLFPYLYLEPWRTGKGKAREEDKNRERMDKVG